jgi:3-hydroxybutyryl-CoA dehydrogenase
MGLGIAQIMAMQGIETILYDVREEALKTAAATIKKQLEIAVEKGKLSISDKDKAWSYLRFSSSFSDLQADFFIEAIVEQLDAKVNLFCALAAQNKPDVILATNTSTIPISRIASGVPNPERVVGMHFFNPAHLMKLVEVVGGAATSEIVIQRTVNLAIACGKSPIKCTDAPGFIVNRVARPYYLES